MSALDRFERILNKAGDAMGRLPPDDRAFIIELFEATDRFKARLLHLARVESEHEDSLRRQRVSIRQSRARAA